MNIPLQDFENYLLNKNLKAKTIKHYLYYFAHFSLYPIYNQESVNMFLVEKANRNIVARSFLINFQKFLKLNNRQYGYTPEQVYDISQVELPKLTGRVSSRIQKTLSEEDINLLEQKLPTIELKLMLNLSYKCGFRLQEMVRLKADSFYWKDWNRDTSKMGKVNVLGKGDKERIALIPPELMEKVKNYVKDNGLRIANSKDKRIFVLQERSWEEYLAKAGVDAGLTKLDEEGKYIEGTRIHPHLLRHSYAHNLVMKGVNIIFVKDALGHSSITSTQRYTNISTDELSNEIQKKAFS